MLVSWKARPRSWARRRVAQVVGRDAHDRRHHHPDHARHPPAVEQAGVQVGGGLRLHVHGEAGEVLQGPAVGDGEVAGDQLQAAEHRLVLRLAGERRAGGALQGGHAGAAVVGGEVFAAVAQRLAVDHVVAVPAPAVEQVRPGAGARVEQRGGGGEALRSGADGRGGRGEEVAGGDGGGGGGRAHDGATPGGRQPSARNSAPAVREGALDLLEAAERRRKANSRTAEGCRSAATRRAGRP